MTQNKWDDDIFFFPVEGETSDDDEANLPEEGDDENPDDENPTPPDDGRDLNFYRTAYEQHTGQIQQMQQQIWQMAAMIPQQPQAPQVPPADDEEEDVEEPDFDNMSNRDLAKWIQKNVVNGVKKSLLGEVSQIRTQLENDKATSAQRTLEEKVQACIQKFPDFIVLREQMLQAARGELKHITDPEQLYYIVKGRVVTELEQKKRTQRPQGPNPQQNPQRQPNPQQSKPKGERPTGSPPLTPAGKLDMKSAFDAALKTTGIKFKE